MRFCQADIRLGCTRENPGDLFGADGKQITMMRAVKDRGVWDERGYPVELSFSDEHDRPMRNDKGCAKLRDTYDKQGNLAEEACLDEADHLVRNTKGLRK